MGALPWVWGAVPGDVVAGRRDGEVLRAVVVRAAPSTVFRWLCQLKVAPYSYDLVDNGGRRSPRTLTPGVERLAVGDRVMTLFELEAFEPGRSITLRPRTRLAPGGLRIAYRTDPHPTGTLLSGRMLTAGGDEGAAARWRDLALAWGDLPMMRKQLHTLRDLSEAEERSD